MEIIYETIFYHWSYVYFSYKFIPKKKVCYTHLFDFCIIWNSRKLLASTHCSRLLGTSIHRRYFYMLCTRSFIKKYTNFIFFQIKLYVYECFDRLNAIIYIYIQYVIKTDGSNSGLISALSTFLFVGFTCL